MRRVLFTVLGTAALLLLLSALVVVSPEAELPQNALPAMPVAAQAVMMPQAQAGADFSGGAVVRAEGLRFVPVMPASSTVAPKTILCRDANGRVLTTARYVQSVHQVFHVEVACG